MPDRHKTPMRIVDQGISGSFDNVMAAASPAAYGQILPDHCLRSRSGSPGRGRRRPLIRWLAGAAAPGLGVDAATATHAALGYLIGHHLHAGEQDASERHDHPGRYRSFFSSIVIAVQIFNPAVGRRRVRPFGSLQLTDDRGRSYLFAAAQQSRYDRAAVAASSAGWCSSAG